jgi:hypothetical protein
MQKETKEMPSDQLGGFASIISRTFKDDPKAMVETSTTKLGKENNWTQQ